MPDKEEEKSKGVHNAPKDLPPPDAAEAEGEAPRGVTPDPRTDENSEAPTPQRGVTPDPKDGGNG